MNVFMFPGQGSQSPGMGRQLFDEVAEFGKWEPAIDDLLGYSIRELCLEGSERGRLDKTQHTQPALYVVNALHYWNRLRQDPVKPDYVAGHSVGEYNALWAAGAFDFMTGLRLVRKRGEMMSQARDGGLVAVIGLSPEQITATLEKHGLSGIDVANYNAPSQTVISGPVYEIDRARELMESAGAQLSLRLSVSAAFHSRYMAESGAAFAGFLTPFEFHPLEIAVVSNVTARPYPADDPSAVKALLIQQISRPVQWTDTIRYLKGKGATSFHEIGPGTVLAGLLRRIEREAEPIVEQASPRPLVKQLEHEPDPAPAAAVSARQVSGDGPSDRARNGKPPLEQESPRPLVKRLAPELNPAPMAAGPARQVSGDGSSHQARNGQVKPGAFGSSEFKADYGVRYAYVAGGICDGVASKEMVVAMGRAGLMGCLGAGGMELTEIEADVRSIQAELTGGEAYGVSLLANIARPALEQQTVELLLRSGVRYLEAVNFMRIPASLVRFRFKGARRLPNGDAFVPNRILARVSRPEVALSFMQPAPEQLLDELAASGQLTAEETTLARSVPMSEDICATADSGGHTDQGVAAALLPVTLGLRDEAMARYGYRKRIRVGAAGGIGTPQAAAAAFIMGADFIVTCSINHCTVEAATSDSVKDMLQAINVQDTAYAPDGDMFELGAKVQVLRRGLFFPARANRLFAVYQQYDSLDSIDAKTRHQIEDRYFKRSFDEVWQETKARLASTSHQEIELAERNAKHKMGLVFRWYFDWASRLAKAGDVEQRVNYQVHCGPALGAFNQWVKNMELADWRRRHVADIAERLLAGAANLLNERFAAMTAS